MQFINEEGLQEIDLFSGLVNLERNPNLRLYSDGLETDEYMYYIPGRGICYEDKCVIGKGSQEALYVLESLGWVLHHKFFIKDMSPVRIDMQKVAQCGLNDIQKMLARNMNASLQEAIEDGYKQTVRCNNEKITSKNRSCNKDKTVNGKFIISRAECYADTGLKPGMIYCFAGHLNGPLCERCIQRDCCNKSKINKKEN